MRVKARFMCSDSENACNHLDTLAPQSADAAARHLRIRIDATDDNFLDAGVENRVGTRRRPAFVATRLEVHIERGLAQRVFMTTPSRILDGVALGMRLTVLLVVPFPQNLAINRHNDCAHHRIRAYRAGTLSSQLDAVLHPRMMLTHFHITAYW